MLLRNKLKRESIAIDVEQARGGNPLEGSVPIDCGSALTGTLVGLGLDGQARIDFPGNPTFGPLPARSCIPLASSDVGKEVVLLFDGGDLRRPIVMGLVQCPASEAPTVPQEIELDGKRIELTAKDTITLRCGEASITLRRGGKIVIRGTHVVSEAAGVNRIRGGSVQLN